MKIKELLPNSSRKKAKKLVAQLKDIAKDNNPEENEERGGWGANIYSGIPDNPRITR